MTHYIALDSRWRNREQYPNENEYSVTEEQTRKWPSFASNDQHAQQKDSCRVAMEHLVIPYDATLLTDYPVLYVHFRSANFRDRTKIFTIDNRMPESNFVMRVDYVQEVAGTPVFIHYKPVTKNQAMRYLKGAPVTVSIRDPTGAVLAQRDTSVPDDPDSSVQTHITFQLTEYEQHDHVTLLT